MSVLFGNVEIFVDKYLDFSQAAGAVAFKTLVVFIA